MNCKVLLCQTALLLLPAMLDAQAVASVHPQNSASVTSPAQRTISVNFNQTPLKAALDEIASQAGMRVVYASSVTPIDRPVTMRVKEVSASQAMQRVLESTG